MLFSWQNPLSLSYVAPSYPHPIFFMTPLSLLWTPEPPPAPFIRSVSTSECANRLLLCTLMSTVIVSADIFKVQWSTKDPLQHFSKHLECWLYKLWHCMFSFPPFLTISPFDPLRVLCDIHPKPRHKNNHISPANMYLYYLPQKSPDGLKIIHLKCASLFKFVQPLCQVLPDLFPFLKK